MSYIKKLLCCFLIYSLITLPLTSCSKGGGGGSETSTDLLLVENDASLVSGLISSKDGAFVFLKSEDQLGSKEIDRVICFDNNGYIGSFIINIDGNISWANSEGIVTTSTNDISNDTIIPENNQIPIANAGIDQSVKTNSTVYLDGSLSSYTNIVGMRFEWSFISIPNGSNSVLTSAETLNPSFFVDIDGVYTIKLTISDDSNHISSDTVSISASSSNGVNFQSGLVSYYPFNGNALDESGNDNNGVVVGSVPFSSSFSNQAPVFSSRDTYVRIPGAESNVNGWNKITVSAWVKMNKYTTYGDVVSRGADYINYGNTASYGIRIGGDYGYWVSGSFYVGFAPGDTESVLPATFAKNTTPYPPTGTWYHVLGTFDGQFLRYYVNGQLDGEIEVASQHIGAPLFDTAVHETLIGKSATRPTWYDTHIDGMVDDVRIYNRALTAMEIQGLYEQKGSAITTASKASFYRQIFLGASLGENSFTERGLNETMDLVIDFIQYDLKNLVSPAAKKIAEHLSAELDTHRNNPDPLEDRVKTYVISEAISCASDLHECALNVVNSFKDAIGKESQIINTTNNNYGTGASYSEIISPEKLSIRDDAGNTAKISDQCGFTVSPTTGSAPLDVSLTAKSLNFNNQGLAHKWEYESVGSSSGKPITIGSGYEASLRLALKGTYKVILTTSFNRGGGMLCQSEKLVTVTEPAPEPAPVESTNSMQWVLTDSCDDNQTVSFKLFTESEDRIYTTPSGYFTGTKTITINSCKNGEKICFGGKTADIWGNGLTGKTFGVGYNNEKTCTDCCGTCDGGTYTYNASCGAAPIDNPNELSEGECFNTDLEGYNPCLPSCCRIDGVLTCLPNLSEDSACR